MIKKVIALTLILALALLTFAACGKKGASVKTGLGVVLGIGSSKDAGEKDGLAQVDATIAAVIVGKDGKIIKCVIDAAQTKVNFSAEGKITTDLATEYKTKNELKEAYNMKSKSGIGKEWYEQAAAFAEYVVGKTLADVKGIALTDGYPSDAELTASVTVHVTDWITAIEKAMNNAKDLGAKASDKLGLAVVTNIKDSKDATAEAAGLARAYSHYSATTLDKNGKITSSIIDASQGNVNFDAAGKITSDFKTEIKTKNELKEAYNMKSKSKIGKEWYEQAAAFADYLKGKTTAEVSGIAVKDGYADVAELTSSVTVHVTDFIAVVEKAAGYAK
ncbi:MAG: hypothetical protein PHV32_04225 [Eubacteriales bacterium]|nr:hypothetical protein [Eubacteriales bacterium]